MALSIRWFEYALPALSPLAHRYFSDGKRVGLYVLLEDDAGHFAYGEIAPLPDVHGISHKDIVRALCDLDRQALAQTLSHHLENEDPDFCLKLHLPSVAIFGLEMALSTLRKKRVSQKIQDSGFFLPLCALILEQDDRAVLQAEQLVHMGFTCLKLKVSGATQAKDLAMLKAIRSVVGQKVKLRVDANRSFSLDEAILWGEKIRSLDIEYMEEPLKDPTLIPVFFQKTGLWSALDESFSSAMDFFKLEGINTLIIKPTRFGGLKELSAIKQMAKKSKVDLVFSYAFESSLGLSFGACLAKNMGTSSRAHGLIPPLLWQEESAHRVLRSVRGRISVADCEEYQHIFTHMNKPWIRELVW